MIIGRNTELKQLETLYARKGSATLVLYGEKNIGKSALLQEFIKNKRAVYYQAAQVSMQKQINTYYSKNVKNSTKEDVKNDSKNDAADIMIDSYTSLFAEVSHLAKEGEKTVYIFDEFQYMLYENSDFVKGLNELLNAGEPTKEVLVILSSSSVSLVEKEIADLISPVKQYLSGIMKIRELKFKDVIKLFPSYSLRDSIIIYSILGGIPGYLHCFDFKKDIKQNILEHILDENSFLHEEGMRRIREQLRDVTVYNTLLLLLAQNKNKLNEIYAQTGYSRAKISVYFKNLMEIGVVEKEYSLDIPGNSNCRKGIYGITNKYAKFWYSYVYDYILDSFSYNDREQYYENVIKPSILSFSNSTFSALCREYMYVLNRKKALKFEAEKQGLFDGKETFIDYIGLSHDRRAVMAFCDFEHPVMDYEFYEEKITALTKMKMKAEQIYLFSTSGFDDKLKQLSESDDSVILIEMDDL